MSFHSNCLKLLNGLSLFVLVQVIWALPAFAQAPTRQLAVPSGSTISPKTGGTGKESKYLEWAPKINAAVSEFKRGRRSAPGKVFAEFWRTDKKNPIPRKFLSEILIGQGKLEQARRVLGSTLRLKRAEEIEPVPLTDWHILAPLKYDGKKSFDAELKPEKEKFNSAAKYTGDGRVCRWKKAKGPRVDFRAILEIEGTGIGYGYCQFVSRKAGWVRFGIGSGDGVKLWLNDELIHSNFARRDIGEDQDEVYAWVRRGRNTVRVKESSTGDEFRFYIQIYDELDLPSSKFLDRALAGYKALDRARYDDALESFMEAEAERPGVPEVAVGIAETMLRQENLVAARGWVNRALLERANSVRGLQVYGEVMLRLRQPLKAFDAFRAAYRSSEYSDEKAFQLWTESAVKARWNLQRGLALLDRSRGFRKAKKKTEAAGSLEEARAFLEQTFVGLADLSVYHREGGDRKQAASYGVRAIQKLTPQQVALNCSAEWLLNLVKDLRQTQPEDQASRERILKLVSQVDPTRSDLIRELLAVKPAAGSSAISRKIEALLKKRPESALYKEYTSRLYSAGDYRRCAELCAEGLASGIVSRTLRYRQANALVKVKSYEEAEALYKGLLEEKDYVKRATEALKKLARIPRAGS